MRRILGFLLIAIFAAGNAMAEDTVRTFPGEPPRDFRRSAGQIVRYWCSEIWATRSHDADPGIFVSDFSEDIAVVDSSVQPSRHGLNRIDRYWKEMVALQAALLRIQEQEMMSGTSGIDNWFRLKTEHDQIVSSIGTIETRIANQGPIKDRRAKLQLISEALGTARGLKSRLEKMEAALERATRMWNLSKHDDTTGLYRDEINLNISNIQRDISTASTTAVSSGLVDGSPTSIDDLIALLGADKLFHEGELKREMNEFGVSDKDVAELARLKKRREELAAEMHEAAKAAASEFDHRNALSLQLDNMILVVAMIDGCIADQRAYLGPPPADGAPQTVTLPSGDTVPAYGDTITGFFKYTCDFPNMTDPEDRHLVWQRGTMVITFRDNNEVAITLRSPSLVDGRVASDQFIYGTAIWDPVTGQVGGAIGAEVTYGPQWFDRFSAFITNKNGRTEVSGLYCSGPKPEHLNDIINELGGTKLLAYCGGKFWGPEEMLEPSGPERDPQCGF